jgi:hypothetical protein
VDTLNGERGIMKNVFRISLPVPFRLLTCILLSLLLLGYSGCCKPDCEDKCCGDDGCGGTCKDTCTGGRVCLEDWCICADCHPQCTGKCCGDDGCGGSCPDNCPAGYICNASTCDCEVCGCDSASCLPDQCCVGCICVAMDCENFECGLDPVCGFDCGSCPPCTWCEQGKCEFIGAVCQSDADCAVSECCIDCVCRSMNCTGLECGPDVVCGFECGPCLTGNRCLDGTCVEGCDTRDNCDFGQSCDAATHSCYDDTRGPFCEPCGPSSPTDPHRCGPAPNFCLMTDNNPSLEPFCGVDCDHRQGCPRGYRCNSVLIASGGPCRSDDECVSGQCHINPGDDVGFCLCSSDDQCPQDSCNDSWMSCRYTLRACTPGGSECSDPIPCLDGLCQIGRNCIPMEGLTCTDLRP